MIFGFIILKAHEKNWLIYLLVTSVVLSMGSNLEIINNYIFFDYLPGYNKFRSVTFIIIVSIFSVILISCLALQKFIEDPKKYRDDIIKSLYITICIFSLIFISYFVLSFSGKVDANFANYPDWFINSLIEDRKSLFLADLLKGSILVVVMVSLMFGLFYEKISKSIFGVLLISIISFDHFQNNSGILKTDSMCEVFNDCSFKKMKELEIRMTEADQYILENNVDRKRVLNLQNTFNDARTSYYHSSIGGYHGAKMRRYQDVIENVFQEERNDIVAKLRESNTNFSDNNIINMLNVGYIQFGDNRNNVVKNNFSYGNAWFVNKIIKVESAEEEMEALTGLDSKKEAIIDISKFNLNNNSTEFNIGGRINLIEYSPKRLLYKSSNNYASFVVFSEI